ncbi:MAG: hypothetical protein LBB53_03835 [Prevotellaceae bacterium]|nr:hypothetical protein [Prevotellaceae bacterium]
MIFLIIFFRPNTTAQEFAYDVDFLTYFDNREYHFSPNLGSSKTFFGFHLTPAVGLALIDKENGEHKLLAGITYIQPFGTDWKSVKILPTVFYNYKKIGFALNFGTIPYSKMLEKLPSYFRRSSANYSAPNIQGALFQYKNKIGYVELLCDWRGMQSKDTREAFLLAVSGKAQFKMFFFGSIAQMNHLANTLDADEGVCDDILINPFAGFDFSKIVFFDKFTIQAGYLFGFQRERITDTKYLPQGGIVDLDLKWRFLQLKNSFYFGENQMPLYENYKSLLNQGDCIYQANIYNKTDFTFEILKKTFVTCKFTWQLHCVPTYALSHRQLLTLNFNIDGMFCKKNRLY